MALSCAGFAAAGTFAMTPLANADAARRHSKTHGATGHCHAAAGAAGKCRSRHSAKPRGSTQTSEYGPTRSAPQTGGGSGTGASPVTAKATDR